MAYGLDDRIRRGLDDGGEYHERFDYEYNADLGFSERIGRHDDPEEDLEAAAEAVDDE